MHFHFREGLPALGLPPLSTGYGGRNVTFIEMCSDLGSSIVLVPIIGVLGNVAIAKAFGKFVLKFTNIGYLTYRNLLLTTPPM